MSRLRAWIKDALRQVGALLQDTGDPRPAAISEQLVGRVRLLVLVVVLGTISAVGSGIGWNWWGALTIYVVASAILVGSIYRPWFSWVTSLLDTQVVVLVLAGYVVAGLPRSVLNSRTTYDIFFFCILLAGLREDPRIPLFVGLVSAAEWLGLSWWARRVDLALPPDPWSRSLYGAIEFKVVWVRAVWLGLAGVLTMALARHARTMRNWAGLDGDTGLALRGPFLARMKEEIARARVRHESLALAVIDVDGFQGLSIRDPEVEIDRATIAWGTRLREKLRPQDFAARSGEQEFFVAMPLTQPDEAISFAEDLRISLGLVPLAVAGHIERLTVSIGIACWPIDGQSLEEILARADVRLFFAKKEGADRVVGPPAPQIAQVTELRPQRSD